MENPEQQIFVLEIIEIVKAIGPYMVAIAGMLFGYLQSKKSTESQRQIAEITKEKDLTIVAMQSDSTFKLEQRKLRSTAFLKLQEIYSPMYAKVEALVQTYAAIVTNDKSAASIRGTLAELVVDDYISLSLVSRKVVLAEAIAICQSLEDQKAYEIAVKLDSKINEALGLLDFTGETWGEDYLNQLKSIRREYGLLYVSFFNKIANSEIAHRLD